MSDREARELARAKFSEELSQGAPDGESLVGPDRVSEVFSERVVRVEGLGGRPDRLIDSQVPLVADDEGERRLVDFDLVREGEVFEPANGPEVRLGAELAEGISVGPLKVVPEGEAPGELLDSDTLSYANALPDTDVAVKVTATGFETFHQLRSEDSPEVQRLSLGLPAGASLEAAQGGSARVVAGGREKVRIRPPVAVDAGGERVPVSYEVDGNDLLVVARHRQGDFAYPILVDPEVLVKEDWACSQSWNCTTTWFHGHGQRGDGSLEPWSVLHGLNDQHWRFETNFNSGHPYYWGAYAARRSCYADSMMSDCYRAAHGGGPLPQQQWHWDGLHILVRPDVWYTAGSSAKWVYDPPGQTTQIYRADFGAKFLRNGRTGNGHPFMYHGIWSSPNQNWADSEIHQGDGWGNLTHHWSADWGTSMPGPQRAVFGFHSFGDQALWNHWRYGYMGAAILQLTDPEPPTITEAVPTLTENGQTVAANKWTKDGTYTFAPRATDPGLGVRRMRLEAPLAGGGSAIHERGVFCAGTKGLPCPSNAKLPFNASQPVFSISANDASTAAGNQPLPNGQHNITIRAGDALLSGNDENGRPHESSVTKTVRVDRAAPSTTPGGELWEGRSQPLAPADYGLSVTGEDAHSGAKRVSYTIRDANELVVRSQGADRPACDAATCSASPFEHQFTVDFEGLAPGTYSVETTSTDAVGNTHGANRFNVTLGGRQPEAPDAIDDDAADDPSEDPDEQAPDDPTLSSAQETQARSILSASTILSTLAGSSSYTVAEIGPWTEPTPEGGERFIGATVLLTLDTPKDWPMTSWPHVGYLPTTSHYFDVIDRYSVDDATELLVDIDLSEDRIVGVDPIGGTRTFEATRAFDTILQGPSPWEGF